VYTKMECEHCKNKFTTISSLNNHKKTAKYCLEKRQKSVIFCCNICEKSFSSKYGLTKHSINCQEIYLHIKEKLDKKYELQLSQKDRQIQQLQDKLENIAIKAVQRPTTVKNTQINNFIQKMEPITHEHLVDHAPKLTIEHIQKGAYGYAEYALEYPLKDRVACVDYGRRKIKFKDTDGNVVTDPEMIKLAPMFFESIKEKSSELVHELNTPNMDSAMFEGVAKLFNTNADVKNGSTGIKTDFYHDFVKHVCSGSVVE